MQVTLLPLAAVQSNFETAQVVIMLFFFTFLVYFWDMYPHSLLIKILCLVYCN